MRRKVSRLVAKVSAFQDFSNKPVGMEKCTKIVTKFEKVGDKVVERKEQVQATDKFGRPAFMAINPKRRAERQMRKNWNSIPRNERFAARRVLLDAMVNGVEFGTA